ncbi:hypothetical protein [Actinacidiphila glaucinigra]|uniref:hypothetical protein n=1 Tax=Actinacidiphila glaucinigra TaxID=235986 RepID=UPI0035D944B7
MSATAPTAAQDQRTTAPARGATGSTEPNAASAVAAADAVVGYARTANLSPTEQSALREVSEAFGRRGLHDQADDLRAALPSMTAAARGPEWTARYGCFAECILDHAGADGEPGWHQAAPVILTAPDGCAPVAPVFISRVTQVSDDADAFGIQTRTWLDFEYPTTLELDLPQARQFVADARQALDRFEAALAVQERISSADCPGDPVLRAQHMADVEARIQAVNAAELYVYLEKRGIALKAADGENADALTEPVLLRIDGVPTLLAPASAKAADLLYYVQEAYAAGLAVQA